MQNKLLYPDNLLFYGDCLTFLKGYDINGERYIKDSSVDLIYLDPPFNSNKVYNVIFKEANGKPSASQIKGFEDTWTWNDDVIQEYDDIKLDKNNRFGNLSDTMQGLEKILGTSNMFAYLVMMATRLIEMKRVLKSTASIYLHCDQTAGHYIKVMMDAIFGVNNFRNEVVWYYRGGGVPKNDFARRHDILLRYSKTNKYFFNVDEIRTPYSKDSMERLQYVARSFRGNKVYDKYRPHPKGKHPDDVLLIQPTMPSSKERLGYPTQKPEALLEVIVKASSNEGDLVLDPFCGCGTTVAVAERLNRRWIGIDITHIALTLIKSRLGDDVHYKVVGEPTTTEDAIKLADKDKWQFQLWALGLVGARPISGIKKGKDEGIDGKKIFTDLKKSPHTIIISVKGGGISPGHIRDLVGTIENNKADIGVFISLKKPTKDMKLEALKAGRFDPHDLTQKTYPRIQLLTIEELLGGKSVQYPHWREEKTFTKAPKVKVKHKQSKGLIHTLR